MRRKPRSVIRFLMALDAFSDAADNLARAWELAIRDLRGIDPDEALDIGVTGYPFKSVFDEVANDIDEWVTKQQEEQG